MTAITLQRVGLAALQDLGRPGLAHLGIAENGAADGWAARVANTLVGNAVSRPLIEIVASEFAFDADVAVMIAVTGAAAHVFVDGAAQPCWELLVVPAGSVVRIPAPEAGLRSYVAVNGHLAAPATLGSVAPDRLIGVGAALTSGQRIGLQSSFAGLVHPYFGMPVFRLGPPPPGLGRRMVIDVTRGPEAGEFVDLAGHLAGRTYEMSAQSDAIGLRLTGPAPVRPSTEEIVSRGVPVGAVEVTPGGGLLVLLRGRLVTAGYPVVAVATRAAIDRLGQARPGDVVGFRFVEPTAAQAAYQERARQLADLRTRVVGALSAVGLEAVLDRADQPHTDAPRG